MRPQEIINDEIDVFDETPWQSTRRVIGLITPRDLHLVDKLQIGDSLVFIRGRLTKNQVRHKVELRKKQTGKTQYVLRNCDETVSVWRWK